MIIGIRYNITMDNLFKSFAKIPYYFYLLFINLISLFILIPLYSDNNLLAWDFVGHISAIQYTKDYLFPDLQGWNNSHSLGYPQGYFYPFLWHYLIAAFSFVYDSPVFWIKLFFGITFLSIPWLGYNVSRRIAERLNIGKSDKNDSSDILVHLTHHDRDIIAVISSLIIFLSIVFGPMVFGGTLRSFLAIGLITNFYSLGLFLLYLYFLLGKNEVFVLRKTLLLSLLLSLILLSHLVTALVAIIITIAFLGMHKWRSFQISKSESKKTGFWGNYLMRVLKSNYFITLLISFFTTLFFYIPLIQDSGYISPIQGIRSDSIITLVVFCLGIISLVLIYFLRKKIIISEITALILSFGLMAVLALLELVSSRLNLNLYMDRIQPYRLLSFALIFIPAITFLIFIKALENFTINKLGKNTYSVILCFSALVLVLISGIGIYQSRRFAQSFGEVSFNSTNINNAQNNNYLSLFRSEDSYYLYRVLSYPELSGINNIHIVNSQFNESTYLNSYFVALKDSIYGKIDSEEDVNYPESYKLSKSESLNLLNIFNIQNLIFTDTKKFNYDICDKNTISLFAEISLINIESGDVKAYSCKIDFNGNDAEKILVSTDNQNKWFDITRSQLKDSQNNIFIDKLKNSSGDVKAITPENKINWSENNQSFEIEVINSDKPGNSISILAIQYNPNWKAYKEISGQKVEITVYRAAPNLIAIKDIGKITFEFQNTLIENILKYLGVTLFTGNLLAVIFFTVTSYRKKLK